MSPQGGSDENIILNKFRLKLLHDYYFYFFQSDDKSALQFIVTSNTETILTR